MRISRPLLSLAVLGALATPAVIAARMQAQDEHHVQQQDRKQHRDTDRDKDRDQDQDRDHSRVYDQSNHDYHPWNAQEDSAYRGWLRERKQKYTGYDRLPANQQQQYWAWRHQHPDQEQREGDRTQRDHDHTDRDKPRRDRDNDHDRSVPPGQHLA